MFIDNLHTCKYIMLCGCYGMELNYFVIVKGKKNAVQHFFIRISFRCDCPCKITSSLDFLSILKKYPYFTVSKKNCTNTNTCKKPCTKNKNFL